MTGPPSDTLLTIRTFCLLSVFCMCLQDASKSSFASLMGICTMQRRVKMGLISTWKRIHRRSSFCAQMKKDQILVNYHLIIKCLRGEFLCFLSRTQVFATAIANVCNLTCKRLRPRSHAFIFIIIYLLKSRNGCSKEHFLMSALRQIWAKKSRLEPLLEGYEWEKAILNDGFLAQNGPNVQ